MTYRDDHEAALARIAALEEELEQARSKTDSDRFDGELAAKIVLMKYLFSVTSGRDRDPLVVLIETELGDPDFHDQVRLFVNALEIEGRPFTIDTHQGLANAIRSLLQKAAIIDRALR